MRHLGIDFGKKRIGIAITDEEGKIAFPFCVLENNKSLLAEIKKIIQSEGVKKIVIGESKNYESVPNQIMGEVNQFKKNLKEFFGGEIVFEPEFMTSVQAKRGLGGRRRDKRNTKKSKSHFDKNIQTKDIDISSAVIILQSYLQKIAK